MDGGIRYAHPVYHLTAELVGRVQLVHSSEDHERWGVWGSLRYDRRSGLERGPYLTLSSSGGPASLDGLDKLLGFGALADPPADDGAQTGWRIDTEFGYGIPYPGVGMTGTPWGGITLSDGEPEYRVGYRILFDSGLRLSLAGALRNRLTPNEPPDYLITFLLSLR